MGKVANRYLILTGFGFSSITDLSSFPTLLSSTPMRRRSGRLLLKPALSVSAEVKRAHFTDLEDTAILDWLGIRANAESYFKENKSTACKEIAAYLQAERISPHGMIRTWEAIRQRLASILKKYHEAIRKKKQTGWGTGKHEKTIQGA